MFPEDKLKSGVLVEGVSWIFSLLERRWISVIVIFSSSHSKSVSKTLLLDYQLNLFTTLNITSPQPSLSYSWLVNQITLSNILVYWKQCKYSNFFESLISLCYPWRSPERNSSWFARFRLMLSVYNKQKGWEEGWRRGVESIWKSEWFVTIK